MTTRQQRIDKAVKNLAVAVRWCTEQQEACDRARAAARSGDPSVTDDTIRTLDLRVASAIVDIRRAEDAIEDASYREPVSRKAIGEGVGPKTECSQLMTRMFVTILDENGPAEIRRTLRGATVTDANALKGIQKALVFSVGELASDIRSARGHLAFSSGRPHLKRLLRMELPTMSLEAAEWYGEQTDAVQFTLARNVLKAEAKMLGVPLDHTLTIR